MKRILRPLSIALCLAGFAGLMTGIPGASAASPIRVLLLSGQNNHQWHETTPKLQQILEATGRFKVEVNERPDRLTAAALKPFDVIVCNWNGWGQTGDAITNWPAATKTAYLDFVRGGKGHVVVHAGSSSFYDWPEYGELTLANWKLGTTQHGPPHKFPVNIDRPDHPITKGLKPFETTDELWVRPGAHAGATVIASAFAAKDHPQGSGQPEPLAMVGRFGKGRSFTLLLGHEAKFMENPGFVALFTRGTEWAATGRVRIPPPNGSVSGGP